jgi:hypothetical protein
MKFFFNKHSKQQNGAESNGHAAEELVQEPVVDKQDEIAAVIALAVHLYITEVREYENAVVTIQQVIKPYSPWSSKIYGLRQQPMRIPGLSTRIK